MKKICICKDCGGHHVPPTLTTCLQCGNEYMKQAYIDKSDVCCEQCLLDKHSEINESTNKIDNTYCIEWNGPTNKNGYGQTSYKGRAWAAHRLSYNLNNGPLIDGLVIMHKCDNTKCINPRHLEQGTSKENSIDYYIKGYNDKFNLTDEQIKDIINDKDHRESYIAKKYNIPEEAVKVIQSTGLTPSEYTAHKMISTGNGKMISNKRKSNKQTKNYTREIKNLYNNRYTGDEIAKELGLTKSAVYYRINVMKSEGDID